MRVDRKQKTRMRGEQTVTMIGYVAMQARSRPALRSGRAVPPWSRFVSSSRHAPPHTRTIADRCRVLVPVGPALAEASYGLLIEDSAWMVPTSLETSRPEPWPRIGQPARCQISPREDPTVEQGLAVLLISTTEEARELVVQDPEPATLGSPFNPSSEETGTAPR